MGTGKTVSTLTALDQLALAEPVYPALVLAPLRVARSTWPSEVKKWDHLAHIRFSVITGSPKERLAALKADADVYTMNYENLEWLVETLGDKWPFRTVIADEGSRLKSFRTRQGSKRAKALGKVAHTHVNKFVSLTGTPAPNGLVDLWGQMWFVDRGERLGRTYSAFESRWFTKGWDGFSVKPMAHSQVEIENAIKDVCVTISGLPVDEPISNYIYVDLPKDAKALYKDMENIMFAEIEGVGVEAVSAAAKTIKTLQIASGFLYTEEGDWKLVHDEKLDALKSIVEEAAGAPILCAYQFKADLERLKKAYPKGRHLDSNPKTIEDWNAGKIPILFAHAASAGHGLNLQDGGNILVFYGKGWSLEEYQQIIERIGPMRQKQAGYDRPVYIHHIIARDTVDEMVLDRLESKRSVQDILLEAMKRRTK
jgi:SNF2 family DNA or RNA helicase